MKSDDTRSSTRVQVYLHPALNCSIDTQTPDIFLKMLETIPIEHIPSTHSVHVALFRDVTNTEFLQSQLLSRNPDFEYAFVDATTIASRFHLLSAVYKAITIETSGNMKTPNVHSEIVCSLSSNNNVCNRCKSLFLPSVQSQGPYRNTHDPT